MIAALSGVALLALAAAAGAEESTPQEPEPPRPGLLGTGFLSGWERSIGFGLSGSRGNSDNANLNADLRGSYSDPRARWRLKARWHLNSDEGERTEHEAFAELTRDWLLPESPWFVFAQSRYDYDEFEDWDHRIAASGGVGYTFVDTESFDLRGRAGAGLNQTLQPRRRRQPRTMPPPPLPPLLPNAQRTTPEGVAGLDLEWKVNDAMSVRSTNSLLPDLEELGELRAQSTTDWVIELTERWPLSLKLGLVYDFQTVTEEEQHDISYDVSLLYRF